jgi:GTP-binding protein HflX
MVKASSTDIPVERALLVQVHWGRQTKADAAESLGELERLADTAGAAVIGSITQHRDRPTSNFYVGEGKLADIQLGCRQGRANVIIFDNELTSVQVNNLDLALGIKVIDRTELILQIFARRARSSESQMQVELAQLQYLIGRLPTSEKQQRFQGGIGMKGPGESPLQLRNEPMRHRIRELKRKLEVIRERQRLTRGRRPWPLVCLVGYTNAGKSTLLNALAGADAYVDDRLFSTLDTKTRMVKLAPGRQILMTDTVGFIRHLPHGLVASFRSTLDVAAEADLLLMVVDAGHLRLDDHLEVVRDTLKDIGADKVPARLILNKCDTVAPEVVAAWKQVYPDAVAISALSRDGLDELRAAMADSVASHHAGHAGRRKEAGETACSTRLPHRLGTWKTPARGHWIPCAGRMCWRVKTRGGR